MAYDDVTSENGSPKIGGRQNVPGRMQVIAAPDPSPVATAVFDGTAKPIPIEPPDGEMIAVLTPITSPLRLNSGPPELPRLMAASVWM